MPGRVVVQWDKEDCADMGIIKVDLLGLGMMAVLEDSITLIRDHYREEVDLAKLPADDPTVYGTLQKADTVGMFQIESRAQMSCLPRLHPTHFYDIVVQVASFARADCGADGEPLFNAAARKASRGLSAPLAGTGAGAHFGRAALSGATAAGSHDCRRIQRWGSGRTAPRLRLQATARSACAISKSSCAMACNATAFLTRRRSRSFSPSLPSRCMDFRNRMPPALRSLPMPAPI